MHALLWYNGKAIPQGIRRWVLHILWQLTSCLMFNISGSVFPCQHFLWESCRNTAGTSTGHDVSPKNQPTSPGQCQKIRAASWEHQYQNHPVGSLTEPMVFVENLCKCNRTIVHSWASTTCSELASTLPHFPSPEVWENQVIVQHDTNITGMKIWKRLSQSYQWLFPFLLQTSFPFCFSFPSSIKYALNVFIRNALPYFVPTVYFSGMLQLLIVSRAHLKSLIDAMTTGISFNMLSIHCEPKFDFKTQFR